MKEFYQDTYPVENKLERVDYSWEKKLVLDIGCNIGGVGKYVFERGCSGYLGVDLNEEFIAEARRRYGYRYKVKDALEAVREEAGTFNVLIALGILHHLSDATVKKIFSLWNKDIIFEVPTGEIKYKEYKVRTKEWYKDLLNYKTVEILESGMNLSKEYPFERLIFICKDYGNIKDT